MIIDPEDSWSIRNSYNINYNQERRSLLTPPEFTCLHCTNQQERSEFHSEIRAIISEGDVPSTFTVPENINLLIAGNLYIKSGRVRADLPVKIKPSASKVRSVPILHAGNNNGLSPSGLISQFKKLNISAFAIDFRKDTSAFWILKSQEAFHSSGISIISIIGFYDRNDSFSNEVAKSELILVEQQVFTQTKEEVDAALSKMVNFLPSNRLVMVIPAGGVSKTSLRSEAMSYKHALSLAKSMDRKVLFDYDFYNLRFSFSDSTFQEHQVAFMDAVSVFRLIRLSRETALRGVAISGIGEEDARLWTLLNENTEEITISQGKEGAELLKIIHENVGPEFIVPPGRALKKLVLTFDDGPDEAFTSQVLDILKKERVPAVFFVTGLKVEQNIPLLKRIQRDGHEIGNHTFTHPNLLTVSKHRQSIEVRATTRLIECITGRSTNIFRAPYSSDKYINTNKEIIPVSFGGDKKYLRIGDQVNPKDWQSSISAEMIINRTLEQLNKGGIILLHDGGGDRTETIKALPSIIKKARQKGYTFTTLADYSGQSKEQLMPFVSEGNDLYLSYGNTFMAYTFYWLQRIIYVLFFVGLGLGVFRIIFIITLAIKQKLRTNSESNSPELPSVSIIVPAFNEEKTAVKTIDQLLKLSYPDYEVIFIDDGSTDNTLKVVTANFINNKKVRIFSKPNGGKATALNMGVDKSQGKILLCIDADTQVKSDALANLVKNFDSPDVAAVAGNVKVGNAGKWLTSFQSLEYITAQNFERRAFDEVNGITVVPGAIGAFRKDLVIGAGKYKSDTLAEDCDLTMRILRQGYRIKYAEDAVAYTESPETTTQFMKQRLRWSFGVLQSWWKHRDTLFNRKYCGMGLIAMPYLLLFYYLFPMLVPVADIVMLSAFLNGEADQLGMYYFSFLFLDIILSAVSLLMDKEPLHKLLWLIPQRFFYRWILWYILVKTFLKAIKGELISWGFLRRTGSVVLPEQGLSK